ncbi:MAG: DegT/DnrJ/EryC1/StrS family aminotransferase, partial [Saprospiraceae bacterium]|nr:DegT/DnrJ/EryC1/StrS family aminotransferase [Saprospiraceae bacterium]
MQVPFVNFGPVVSEVKSACHDVLNEFLEHGHFVLGQMTTEFEHSYAAFCGTKYCVGVSNGLDALCLSLKAIGIGQGDEVIVPSNTYIATILAIIHANAKPVLCEPDALTYNIDPQKIEPLITAKTKAIMPVHLYGQACEMESIMRIATEYNLAVIEDNAQAQGATYDGKHCGSFGIINATSFY